METNDAQLFAQSAHAPDQTDQRSRLLHCPADLVAPAFARIPVFHELSRAEGPSPQIRKRAEDIEEKIESLQRMKRALRKLTDACSGKGAVSECPILDALDTGKKP
jgi:hypothetical protein